MVATEREILFQTRENSFIHKVSQCNTLMCTESETMCYPNGHFLIYSHCAQWRKKLHMGRKMHNIDRRKKNIVRRKKKVKKRKKILRKLLQLMHYRIFNYFCNEATFWHWCFKISLLTSHYQILDKFISQ